MLPHAFHELQSLDRAVWWMMVGLVMMFFLVRLFHFHQHGAVDLPQMAGEVIREPSETSVSEHDGDHERHHGPHHGHSHKLGWIGIALGLSLHTMIDGIALAASVKADASHTGGWALFGLGTFLAVALHKPLDSVSITSLMISGGWSAGWRHGVNAGFALMCPLGAFVFVVGVEQFSAHQHVIVGCALALAAGVFVCISLSDLLPEMELHSHNRVPLSLALIAGIALAWSIRFLEPQHLHSHTNASTAGEVSPRMCTNIEQRARNPVFSEKPCF
jgi:zinc and cadmium transporter